MSVRSRRGVIASIVLLAAVPAAALSQLFFDGAATVIHVAFAIGFALIASATFDFVMPRWISATARAATAVLSAIFLVQGTAEVVHNDTFSYIAFGVLGQWLEAVLLDVFVLWCLVLLLVASEGRSRILGAFAVPIALCLQVYTHALSYAQVPLGARPEALKLLYLLLFVWILFESLKPPQRQADVAGIF